jgi:hypothetical protein
MNWKNVLLVLMVVYSLIAVIAVVGVINVADANDTEWLLAESEEKICDVDFEDWLWIPGCNLACNPCAGEDNETLEQSDNITEEDKYYPWKASDFEDKGNLLHIGYFMREPKAAVAVIAFVKTAINKERVKDVLVYHNVSFGLDETAEQYYAAILQVHNETGFSENEHEPCGLTVEQAKEIFYIDTDEEATYWLSEQHNWKIGRLYYYILLGIYHSWLYPEDAGSAIAIIRDAETSNATESIIKIDRIAYQLAAIAYFHNRTVIERCILYNEDLPTDELEQVERILLEKADESEILDPTPTPPRRKFNYWQNI